VTKDLENLQEPVDILIRMDHMGKAPREHRRSPGLVFYRSVFRTGYIVCGKMDVTERASSSMQHKLERGVTKVLGCRNSLFMPLISSQQLWVQSYSGAVLPVRIAKNVSLRKQSSV
jgi:hypothetical protein